MPRGGSRFGAGRPGWKRKAESSLALDIRQIARCGRLKPSMWFTWFWTNNYSGERAGSISVKVSDDAGQMTLSYQWTPYGRDPVSVNQPVSIKRTSCNYGGSRPWFCCPKCGRRCAVLYFGSGGYACRHCNHVAYGSQCEDLMDRTRRKQSKIEAKLVDGWCKPKGMHWKTYERIRDEILDCEQQRTQAMAVMMIRMGWAK